MSNKHLVVVYDYGSASPARLAEIAGPLGVSLIFVAAPSPHATELRPVLEMYGAFVETRRMTLNEVVFAVSLHKPDGITTFSERQIGFTADLAERLNLAYHSRGSVGAITRKDEQRRRLQDAGVESVAFALVTDAAYLDAALSEVPLPLVIKPVIGVASRNTVLADDEASCRTQVQAMLGADERSSRTERAVVLEELLIGRECREPWGDYMAVDCLVTDREVHPLFPTGKFGLAPPFRERGCYFPPRESPGDVAGVQQLAVRAVEALDMGNGFADVEIKLTDTGPRVIEVNGRLGGWVDDVAVRANASSPVELAIRSALGMLSDVQVKPPERTAFHYLVVPPMSARRVAAIEAADRLRSIAGVERVSVFAHAGQELAWQDGTESSVAAVLGHAADANELAGIIGMIETTDWISYA